MSRNRNHGHFKDRTGEKRMSNEGLDSEVVAFEEEINAHLAFQEFKKGSLDLIFFSPRRRRRLRDYRNTY